MEKLHKEILMTVMSNGIPFNVRIVKTGDSYGRDFCLINEDEDMIEFYDARYDFYSFGQFVSRYFISTFLERNRVYGLDLYGGEKDWKISQRTMMVIYDWLELHGYEL